MILKLNVMSMKQYSDSCADGIASVITQLQSTANKLFSWFTNNHMKLNPGKCHILLSTKNAIDVHLEEACITTV